MSEFHFYIYLLTNESLNYAGEQHNLIFLQLESNFFFHDEKKSFVYSGGLDICL